MAFGRNNVFRNRNSWGPVSSCGTVPDPEEEYTERMATAQMRQLDPLKEDLADWLNKTLGKRFCFLGYYNMKVKKDIEYRGWVFARKHQTIQ